MWKVKARKTSFHATIEVSTAVPGRIFTSMIRYHHFQSFLPPKDGWEPERRLSTSQSLPQRPENLACKPRNLHGRSREPTPHADLHARIGTLAIIIKFYFVIKIVCLQLYVFIFYFLGELQSVGQVGIELVTVVWPGMANASCSHSFCLPFFLFFVCSMFSVFSKDGLM